MIGLDDITCPTEASADEICNKLSAYGVARIPQFLTESETQEVYREARIATSTMANYRNPYGPCCRFSLEQLPNFLARSRDLVDGDTLKPLPLCFSNTRRVLSSQTLRNTARTYLGPDGGFMEVVSFTKDCIPDTRAVYGKLHYDRRHQLKFIMYLNDVDASNGAFGCIPASHIAGRALFHQGWRKALRLETPDSYQIEHAAAATPEDHYQYRLVPCVVEKDVAIENSVPKQHTLTVVGCSGTLVAFDTHLLHYGGFVTSQTERWTLKGHCFAIVNSSPSRCSLQ